MPLTARSIDVLYISTAGRPFFIKKMGIIDYIKETRVELKHVSWPTRKQSIAFTAIIIGVSIFVAIYLGFFDYIFGLLIEVIL